MAGLLATCHQPDQTGITIRWRDNRATGLTIPEHFADNIAADSLSQLLTVHLADQRTAIAGQYQRTADEIVFEPIVPFTRGMRYVIWLKTKRIGEITIPTLATNDRPELLAIYPSQDSLPDNLLKIYLHFSRPMREGQSLKYVTLRKNGTDTLPAVFLDLQPELWNADRTILTLWLDPGRIKRDLQPNKQLGAPLTHDARYQLDIADAWPDEQGATLGKPTTKTFVTIQRDSLSPDPKRWTVHEPKPGTVQPLIVSFGESLDYSLLTETLRILQEDGKALRGTWQVSDGEKRVSFTPATNWQPGRYKLRIESRLEDLAGNNLNRPFDRDITRKRQNATSQSFADLFFNVR